jgi:hypothetical protein
VIGGPMDMDGPKKGEQCRRMGRWMGVPCRRMGLWMASHADGWASGWCSMQTDGPRRVGNGNGWAGDDCPIETDGPVDGEPCRRMGRWMGVPCRRMGRRMVSHADGWAGGW